MTNLQKLKEKLQYLNSAQIARIVLDPCTHICGNANCARPVGKQCRNDIILYLDSEVKDDEQ